MTSSSSSTSTAWLDAYLEGLAVRDAQEQALKPTYDAYTKLADRNSSHTPHLDPSLTSAPTPPAPILSLTKAPPTATLPPASELARLRLDLSHAQTTKTTLTSTISTLTSQLSTLQITLSTTTARLTTLETSHSSLTRKLRDREHELRGKKELLERVQDELLAAEMQMNVAEQERGRVEGENRELVKRLVEGKEVEAERMNRVGGWS